MAPATGRAGGEQEILGRVTGGRGADHTRAGPTALSQEEIARVAHDEAHDSRDGSTDTGTRPLPDPLPTRTTGLPSAVTATTPQPGPAAPPAGYHPGGYHHGAPAPGQAAEPPPPDRYPARPYPPDEGRFWNGRRLAILALCAVIGSGSGVAAQQLTRHHEPRKPVATPTPTVTPPKPVTVMNIANISINSGFKKPNGGVWRSEQYATANFGRLKPGIGLLLDLGTQRTLRSVTFDARGPMTIELRAGDDGSPDPADPFQRVGAPVTANGKTSLPAKAGGSHRYWLIWVTSLGPGNVAQIGSIGATG